MDRSLLRIEPTVRTATLHQDLRKLAESPIIEHKGATVFRRLIRKGIGDPSPEDLTGYEATTNKVHVMEYVEQSCRGDALLVQGVLYAEAVARRLPETHKPARVLLAREDNTGDVTVRFFLRRPEQTWNREDLEVYKTEGIALWDV
jgi:hypothetical protein